MEIGLEHGAFLDTICFHLQQAAEKLLKALLDARDVRYPRTHDLSHFLDLTQVDCPELLPYPDFLARTPGLSEKTYWPLGTD